ncbi:Ku protein [Devosia sp. Root413D1]|nr:Ku protein [Devosia sp. Root413D1]
MAVRPYWKGYLKLSLVTCAVTLSPATTEGNRVRFHTLNRTTGDRIYTRYVDGETGKTVDDDHQVKAYEKAEDEYVVLEDEELDGVKLDSVRTIDIDEFVEADTVEWTYFDTPYFVVPADEVGEEAFSVIREAMADQNVVGISRLVLGNRERAVMLQPWDTGILLWTLRFGDEVRDEDEYFEKVEEVKPDKEMLSMVERIIEERTAAWNKDMVKDPVQAKLKEIIKAKESPGRKSKPGKAEAEPEAPSNVINLMAALKKSLQNKPGQRAKGGR